MARIDQDPRSPLDRYAEDSPAPVMREMARIASKRGYNQRRLAEALGTAAPNLDRYFASKHPRLDTITRLASALNLPEVYVRLLIEPSRITSDDLDELRHKLGEEIRNSKAFNKNAISDWSSFLRRNPDLAVTLVRDFGIAYSRSAAGLDEPFQPTTAAWPGSVTHQLRVVAERALPHFNLAQYLRQNPKRSDSLFVMLYYFIIEDAGLPRSKAIEILEIARAVFRNNRIDYLPLDEYLRDDPGFRTDEMMARSVQLSRRSKVRK
jgi:transcriptional regulator with XRE-family HTH domain